MRFLNKDRALVHKMGLLEMNELEALGIDSCGESGEFHTVVVDGPIFKERIAVKMSDTIERDGYVFLNCEIEKETSTH